MDIVRTVADLRERVFGWRSQGLTTAVVPTMGGLHDGHVSLVRHGLEQADRVVATLFVNPTQFGQGEDLDAYPRDEARDAAMLRDAGCALLFAPPVEEMYPPGFSTRVIVDGLTDALCGATRVGHFDGVAQVVTKLLNQARCDIAVFGEKDWQQLAVVTRLSRDLDIGTRIVGAPTVREADGLAMSSRNRYLSDAERAIAPALQKALSDAAEAARAGLPTANACREAERAVIAAGFLAVDYIEIRTAGDLQPVARVDQGVPTRIFGAAHLGRARLIDNLAVTS
ncbi:MAG: pantoate--beta-alanine ligase [Pseudomonadota bacterium]